ncbi:MAG TPA: DNA polymerase IV [Actinomycetes bacterium]|nr:DNA polymerase IV [Actinomycetes bacterium]
MSRQQLGRGRPGDVDNSDRDDTGCHVLHVDMDAFYASVELIDHPELIGTPVVVAGGGNRGVVLSATYEARQFGVHSAMPTSRARRLCPNATFLEPHHREYSRISDNVMAIFGSVTPSVEPLSLDEAFLDVSGATRRFGSPAEIGELIRTRVHDEQGITCSVGVASTKFVAKLASGMCKPDGLLVVPADEVIDFLHPLQLGALWGVGDKTEESLHRLGLRTVADLAHTPVGTLERALGPAAGRNLWELAWGRDERVVVPDVAEKSISRDRTFDVDVDDPVIVKRELLRLSQSVASQLRSHDLAGRTIALKIRFADFNTISRSRTLSHPTDISHDIYATAVGLFEALGLDRARLRLVGVRAEGLVDSAAVARQLTFDEQPEAWRDAERAADQASRRFGRGAVRPASLVEPRAPTDRQRGS